MKKALVTGIAGFVGSTLAESLIEQNVEVIGIDSFTDYYDIDLKRRNTAKLVASATRIVEEDIVTADLDALLQGVDTVFHQAGQPGVRPSWGDTFQHYTHANINATQKLLEAVRHSNSVEKFVYASSSSVYGNAVRYPTYETDLPRPLSPYGVTKLAAEHLVGLYAENYGLPTVSLRYFTVYGPRQRPDMAFTKFINLALGGKPIQIYGDGSQIRDFTYIDDVVRANIMAANSDCEPGSVFNVSGGSSVTLNKTLQILEDILGRPINVNRINKVAGDVFQTGGAWDRAKETIGWSPRTSIEDGLRQHVEWARSVNEEGMGARS